MEGSDPNLRAICQWLNCKPGDVKITYRAATVGREAVAYCPKPGCAEPFTDFGPGAEKCLYRKINEHVRWKHPAVDLGALGV